MKKSIFTLAAAVCVALCLAVGANAASIVDTGYCGSENSGRNLMWVLDSDGRLTISGTGKMGLGDEAPWESYRAKIRSVVIGEGVTDISQFAFSDLDELTDAVLPASVTSFDGSAFQGCDKLERIEVSGNSKSFAVVDGIVFSKDAAELVCYPCGRADGVYTVPEGVVSIGYEAFAKCLGLTELVLTDGVKSIADMAFFECRKLTTVTLPNSLTEIGEWAFSACTGLTDVYFDGNVLQGRALNLEEQFFILDDVTIHYCREVEAEIVLENVFRSRRSVEISVITPREAVVFFASYDADGRCLGVEAQRLDAETVETLTFYARLDSARVKLVLLDGSAVPLCSAAEAALTDNE